MPWSLSRGLSLIAVAGLLGVAAGPASAETAPPNPPPFDHAVGGNVVPPGQRGHIPSTALPEALAGEYSDPRMTEQRDLYVDWGRKDWSFARPGEPLPDDADPRDALGDPYSPPGREDVTVHRDGWGVPRIFGETDAATQFGIGYAMAEDRLFQADVFRHVARGTMGAFLGGQEWYDYDRAWQAEFYTDEELLAQFDRYYPDDEQALVQAYVDGINAYIEEARTDPEKLPAEYPALQVVPEPWQLTDSLAVFVLQARDSVEGFGEELYNAALLASLRAQHGDETGDRVFRDVRFHREPGAYTTTPPEEGRFPYPGGGFEGLDAPGVVLPDDPEQALAIATGQSLLASTLDQVGFGRGQASNAITVGGDVAADGQPILLGGPQLDYLVPGIFWEFEAHGPTQHARGIGFAGTAGAALIGKSPTHAWSISYGYTDQIDVFLVPLDPDRPDTHYLRDGEAAEIQGHESTIICKAMVSGLGSPGEEDLCDGQPAALTVLEVERVPEYGPIIGRLDVGGAPHAVVKVRAHWMREVANGRPFLTFNQATDIDGFRAAQEDFNVSLNLHYVDDRGNFGYWHVARPPVRAAGTDVRLPTLGTGAYDWTGFMPLDDVPHAINPDQGFTANWNNQVAEGWHNGDQNSWAELQRVDMLARRMEALAERGEVTAEDIWRVNREASFEDGRWADFPRFLFDAFEEHEPDTTVAAALDVIDAWDGQRTASQVDGTWLHDDPAVTVWDAFLLELQRVVMADDLGERHYAAIGTDFTPNFYHLKSALLLRFLRGDDAPLVPEHDWFNGADRDETIRDVFTDVVAELATEFDGDPSEWRKPALLEQYTPVGLGSVEPHPIMNRGTYNELTVMDVVAPDPPTGPPAAPPSPAPPAAPPAAPPTRAPLPATGGGFAGAALVLAIAAARHGGARTSGRGSPGRQRSHR